MHDPHPSIPLSECHCLNLWRAALRTTDHYNQYVEQAGVSIQQFSLLRHLRVHAPITVTDLAQVMYQDRSTLSRNLKLLEQRGLVTDVSTSGRGKQFTLSDQGNATLDEGEAYWNQAQRELEAQLGAEHMTQWQEILKLLLKEG